MRWIKSESEHCFDLADDNGDLVYLPDSWPRDSWINCVTLRRDSEDIRGPWVWIGRRPEEPISEDEYTWIFDHPDEWWMEFLL